MAVDKLVDSSQLDSDLTSVANAIRAKSGGSGQLAFPAGFVSEIGNIPSGGGGDYVAADWLDMTKPSGRIVSSSTATNPYILAYRTNITSVFAAEWAKVAQYAFRNCSGLVTFVGPKATAIEASGFMYATDLEAVDILGGGNFETDVLRYCSKCSVLILRSTTLTTLSNVNSFRGSRFTTGGAGGTIYIPKTLYDHLGDSSSSDYKHATVWSTIDGYGKITWAKIEGSIYETQYADGTTIPTT